VAAARTKGDLPGAVEYLKTYLEYWMNDKEAWDELAELYLEVCLCVQFAAEDGCLRTKGGGLQLRTVNDCGAC